MIDYSPLWETMKKRHISQYALINKGIDKHTLDQLRKNQNITILTVEKLCNILNCILLIFSPVLISCFSPFAANSLLEMRLHTILP